MPKFEPEAYKMKDVKKTVLNFRVTDELDQEIDKFAKRLELSKPDTVRLILIDTLKLYNYTGKDELYCPYFFEMSEILRILKDIKMRPELEDIKDPGKIAAIVKKYS